MPDSSTETTTADQDEDQAQTQMQADGETTSTDSRFWLTNDILAGVLNLSLIGLLFATAFGVTIDPPAQLLTVFVAVVGLANLWAFGGQAAKRLGDLLGK